MEEGRRDKPAITAIVAVRISRGDGLEDGGTSELEGIVKGKMDCQSVSRKEYNK